jgi:hypothetical protein
MDEKTSLRNLNFGFQDGNRKIYSNIPLPALNDWLLRLEKLDKRSKFLVPLKSLVVIDLNQRYLDNVLMGLFPDIISYDGKEKIKSHDYEHHTKDYFVDVYQKTNNPSIQMIYGRVKGRDSLAEKLTRKNAEKGTMGSDEDYACLLDIAVFFHVEVSDVYSFTIVAPDEKTCYELEEKLQNDSKLSLCDRVDFLEKPNERGYSALHNQFFWNGVGMPAGMVIDVHLETIEGFHRHQNINLGLAKAPSECDRRCYTNETKVGRSHEQEPYQIVILEKNGGTVRESRVPTIDNGFAKYSIVNY